MDEKELNPENAGVPENMDDPESMEMPEGAEAPENFDLEDIIKEFSEYDASETEPVPEQEEDAEKAEEPEQDGEDAKTPVTGDTIRMDELRPEILKQANIQVQGAQPIEDGDEEEAENAEEQVEPFSDQWEPEYEQPMGEYVPPQPIAFKPRSRLRELKRQLVEGPEKQYYAMVDKGLGKVQAAIFVSILVVLLTAGATVLYALGMVQENRMKLMVFGQFFAMLVSALLGSYQLIEGVSDLFTKKHFSRNTLLVVMLAACVADGIFCLQELRVPCCAAFCLATAMSLWGSYERRLALIGQLDSMRKATRLDSVGTVENFFEEKTGLLRGDGKVEDFMETCGELPKPEKVLDAYALIALCVSAGIAVTAGVLHGVSAALQVFASALLASMPATIFIAVTRPFAVLEKKLHTLGTVLCGWQGVEKLSKKRCVPLHHDDLFPGGSVKMNGVKFFGRREPDEIVACCTALVSASGSGLTPLFQQVLESRNGNHYDASQLQYYDVGAVGGIVDSETVLIGSLQALRELGVVIPDGLRVSQALCVAIDGDLCGLFALNYEKTVSATAGLSTLTGYRGLFPVLTCRDVLITEDFIRERFGVRTRRVRMPDFETRRALEEVTLPEEERAALLVTSDGLAPAAYGITGARTLRSASRLGAVIHIIGGGLGLGAVLTLTLLGALELITPVHMFLYQLVWMIPGFLITEWTRTI